MKKSFFLFIIISFITGCSLLKKQTTQPEINVSTEQLEQTVNELIDSLLKEQWLSDFLISHNERPILMASNFNNTTNSNINIDTLYNIINIKLIESGQVRVVISNSVQKTTIPQVLASGESVDYALSATFEKKRKTNTTPSHLIFHLSLWKDKQTQPITTISKTMN